MCMSMLAGVTRAVLKQQLAGRLSRMPILPTCGPKVRMIKIQTRDGRIFWSKTFFYHCVLAYARGFTSRQIVDTWTVEEGWRGIGPKEDIDRLRENHYLRDGIQTKKEFLALFRGRM